MIITAIETFAIDNYKQKDSDIKILKGKYGNFKRLRAGNYRIIFEDDGKITIGEPTIEGAVIGGRILDNTVRGDNWLNKITNQWLS